MIHLALDGITAFSDAPLKAATFSGVAVSGVAFRVMFYTLYSQFIAHNFEPCWASLMVSVLSLGGVQFIAVGIIGEYIARLSANARQCPLYLVADTNLPLAPIHWA